MLTLLRSVLLAMSCVYYGSQRWMWYQVDVVSNLYHQQPFQSNLLVFGGDRAKRGSELSSCDQAAFWITGRALFSTRTPVYKNTRSILQYLFNTVCEKAVRQRLRIFRSTCCCSTPGFRLLVFLYNERRRHCVCVCVFCLWEGSSMS